PSERRLLRRRSGGTGVWSGDGGCHASAQCATRAHGNRRPGFGCGGRIHGTGERLVMKPEPRPLSQLLQDLVDAPPALDVQLSHLTADSRDVVPGSVFIALSGLSRDGGPFVVAAIARGARAIVREGAQHQVETSDGVVQVRLTDLRAA